MKKQTNNYNSLTNDGEIDLFFLIRFLQRNLKFISYSSIVFLIFGIFFAQTRKKVWEGQFEIVIEKEIKKKSKFSNTSEYKFNCEYCKSAKLKQNQFNEN